MDAAREESERAAWESAAEEKETRVARLEAQLEAAREESARHRPRATGLEPLLNRRRRRGRGARAVRGAPRRRRRTRGVGEGRRRGGCRGVFPNGRARRDRGGVHAEPYAGAAALALGKRPHPGRRGAARIDARGDADSVRLRPRNRPLRIPSRIHAARVAIARLAVAARAEKGARRAPARDSRHPRRAPRRARAPAKAAIFSRGAWRSARTGRARRPPRRRRRGARGAARRAARTPPGRCGGACRRGDVERNDAGALFAARLDRFTDVDSCRTARAALAARAEASPRR